MAKLGWTKDMVAPGSNRACAAAYDIRDADMVVTIFTLPSETEVRCPYGTMLWRSLGMA